MYKYLFKFVIIGDTCVGKTSLLQRFTDRRFSEAHDMTIGVEFGTQTIDVLDETKNNQMIPIKIQVWDTAGQEKFRSLISHYFKGAVGVLVCYDITSKHTFKNVRKWIKDANEQCDKNKFVMLVGMKSDLEEKREVTTEEGEALAKEYNIMFREVSAKENINNKDPNVAAKQCFQDISKKILNNLDSFIPNNESGVQLGIKSPNGYLKTINKMNQQYSEDKTCCIIL